MTWPPLRTALVALLLIALASFCLSDLARAAAPSPEHVACVSLLCDEASGCGIAATKLVAPPAAAVAWLVVPLIPVPATTPLLAVTPPTVPERRIVPLGPRSPPVA